MNRSDAKLGERNPMWKGNDLTYAGVHDRMRKRVKKPKWCARCKKKAPRDLANKSGKYLLDKTDWEYLCRKCHMDSDGRNDKLRASGRSRRIPAVVCNCGKTFHRTSGMQGAKYCSNKCKALGMVGKRRRPKATCAFCKKEFWNPQKVVLTCSRKCGSLLSWKTRKKYVLGS